MAKEYQVDYSAQIKQFARNKAVTAEREIHNGMTPIKAAKQFGFGSVQAMTPSIAAHGMLPPLSSAERECFQRQVNDRVPTWKDKEKLGKILGMSTTTIHKWAKGEAAPTPCIVSAVARALGCKREDMVSPVKEHVGAAKHSVRKVEPIDEPIDTPIESPPAVQETSTTTTANGLTIEATERVVTTVQVVKTANGKYGQYVYDGQTIVCTIRAVTKDEENQTWRCTADDLFAIGEELQEVAAQIV